MRKASRNQPQVREEPSDYRVDSPPSTSHSPHMSFSRIHAAAAAAVTACLLAAPAAALAAASDKEADPYGETTALNLPSQDPDTVGNAAGGGGGSLVRTLVGLAVVVAVIYGLYWILRQVKAGREERTVGNGLQTTATVPLGANRSLHLVRAGREMVLVGVADHAVTPIRTYTEDEARAAGLLDDEPAEDDESAPRDPNAPPGTLLAPPRKRGLRGITIGEALERIRQATVRA
jgi:flagellar protein FliO/FliZ